MTAPIYRRPLLLGMFLASIALVVAPACTQEPGFGGGSGGGSETECVPNEPASAACDGRPCLPDGSCSTDPASGGGTGAGGTLVGAGGSDIVLPDETGGSGGTPFGCVDEDVTATPIIPNVVLLIDRSLSMTGATGYAARVQDAIAAGEYTPWECMGSVPGAPGGSGAAEFWRWNVVRTALFNPTDGIVTQLEGNVRFGLTTYSSDATCPELTNVDLFFDNRDAMLAGFACSDLVLQTPTRESLAPTADALAALAVDGPKIIVLATDGAPDNCECPDFNTVACDAAAQTAELAAVVAEAQRVHDTLGITLHVIDVSSPTETDLHDHLADVAAAGGGDIFDGTDPAGLIEAFETIIGDAQSCIVELGGTIVAGKEKTGTVKLDGETLEYDNEENGWGHPAPKQIELLGEACTKFKTGSPTLEIRFPCDVIVE